MASRWEEVGAGVFRRHYGFLSQKIGVVVGAEQVLVVDTRSTPAQADELRADLARLTARPVGWVVNTHYHWDHAFGNCRFPDASIWGHIGCRRQLRVRGEATKADLVAGVDDPELAAGLAAVEIMAPDRVIAREATLDLGDHTVLLRHHGRGHTDSDIVLEASGVLFAGDLVEEGGPPGFDDSFPIAWVSTLSTLAGAAPPVVVPGHGALVTPAFVAGVGDELAAAVEACLAGSPSAGPYPQDLMELVAERVRHEQTGGYPSQR